MQEPKALAPSARRTNMLHLLIGALLTILALEQYMFRLRARLDRGPSHTVEDGLSQSGKQKHSDRLTKPRMNKLEPPEAKIPKWKMKLCHVKGRPLGKPDLQGLPVSFPSKVSAEDIFVHRKNFMKLHTEDLINNLNLLYKNATEINKMYKWESCAVVGNSGNMRFSSFGEAINSHTVVLRTNQAPVEGYRTHVGSKTTFRMLNSLWTFRYINMKEILVERAEENPKMPLEPGVTLLLSRVSGAQFDDMAMAVRHQRKDVKVLLVSSRGISAARRLLAGYRDRLCRAGYGPYLGGSTPSSGFVSVYLMMQLCERLTLYGFGSRDDTGRKAKYHYYKGFGARNFGTVREDGSPVHCWEAELEVLEALSRNGKITICRASKGNTTDSRHHNHNCGAYHRQLSPPPPPDE